jgi:hypothetical protein
MRQNEAPGRRHAAAEVQEVAVDDARAKADASPAAELSFDGFQMPEKSPGRARPGDDGDEVPEERLPGESDRVGLVDGRDAAKGSAFRDTVQGG